MENFPSPESGEKIEKGRILEMLRINGLEHPETKGLVIKWTQQQEASVAKEDTSRAAIVFNMERSDLYLAAGDKEGAFECLEQASLQAHQENEIELHDQIMKKMSVIEG